MRALKTALILTIVLGGCDDRTTTDAGPRIDAGALPDSGASGVDAGSGGTDGGGTDAGSGALDAGSRTDAGGRTDAGSGGPDAGSGGPDAGTDGGSASPDAGPTSGRPPYSGCTLNTQCESGLCDPYDGTPSTSTPAAQCTETCTQSNGSDCPALGVGAPSCLRWDSEASSHCYQGCLDDSSCSAGLFCSPVTLGSGGTRRLCVPDWR